MKAQNTLSCGRRFSIIWISLMLVFALLGTSLPQASSVAAATDTVDPRCTVKHTVKAGETLNKIAKKYSVTPFALAKVNNVPSTYLPVTGEKLCIPGSKWMYEVNAQLVTEYVKGQLFLSGTKLAKLTPYIVKIRDTNGTTWYKLVKVKTDKNGVLAKTIIALPKQLIKQPFLYVCLKNQLQDTLACKAGVNP